VPRIGRNRSDRLRLARGYRDAEIKVGRAIRASSLAAERERLVLSTKTARPTREDAWREIRESLAAGHRLCCAGSAGDR
jgi:hypothetical protein